MAKDPLADLVFGPESPDDNGIIQEAVHILECAKRTYDACHVFSCRIQAWHMCRIFTCAIILTDSILATRPVTDTQVLIRLGVICTMTWIIVDWLWYRRTHDITDHYNIDTIDGTSETRSMGLINNPGRQKELDMCMWIAYPMCTYPYPPNINAFATDAFDALYDLDKFTQLDKKEQARAVAIKAVYYYLTQ